MNRNYNSKAVRAYLNYNSIVNYRKFRKFRVNPRYLKIKTNFFPISYQNTNIRISSNRNAKNVYKKYKILFDELKHDLIVPVNLFG